MRIIPAIDLKDGHVVCAHGGKRSEYQPLHTPAFPSSKLLDLVRKLRSKYELFYIADLDAINRAIGKAHDDSTANSELNAELIAELCDSFPDIALWLDTGLRNDADYRRTLSATSAASVTPIIGSETLNDIETLARMAKTNPDFILSLDFFNRQLRGPAELLHHADLWPSTIIVLALDAVGSSNGPDLGLCEYIQSLAGKRRIVYGGGIRTHTNNDDLNTLESIGINDVLLARAIYAGEV